MPKYICYNWFGTIADHCLDFSAESYKRWGVTKLHNKSLIPELVLPNDIVFVKTDFVYNGVFQRDYLPKINNPFILITGTSSYEVSKGHPIDDIIIDSNVLRWYCTNAPTNLSDKIIPLPIGFEEPYSDRNGGNQEILDQLRLERTSWQNKKDKILLPHHTLDTNPDRASLFSELKSLPFVEAQGEKLSFSDYLRKIDQYKFVICLEGSGPDVHRNYEALLVDTVPINMKNCIHELFKTYNLPGEFVTSWSELNEENFHTMLVKNYNMEVIESFLEISFHAKNIKGNNEN
tara:strand:- start:1464 stop:2333 length:870 start_codon:yes stop_codon:yes gene_type:complete